LGEAEKTFPAPCGRLIRDIIPPVAELNARSYVRKTGQHLVFVLRRFSERLRDDCRRDFRLKK
jgi:hypothetical protein